MCIESQPARRTWSSRIARHWQNRKQYRSTTDWLWSLYNRVLISRLGRFLPLRGRLRPVQLANLDKPLWLRLGTTDWLVLDGVFFRSEYRAALNGNNDIRQILDLGSNIGLSIRLWQEHFPGATIVGVEPDEGNLEICRRNVEEGGQSVKLLQACVAAQPRTVYLQRDKGEWAISMTDQQTGGVGVPAKTVPLILAETQMSGDIDLLKCDVEGAEQELFADCSAWIGRVRQMLVELHDPYTKAMFLADLERCGGQFDCESLDEGAAYALLFLKKRA